MYIRDTISVCLFANETTINPFPLNFLHILHLHGFFPVAFKVPIPARGSSESHQ